MHDQRVNTGHHDFNEQLSFWLNRACGLSYNEVVFLDKFGSVLDAEDLFYELKWDPDIFEAQVIHPCALSASTSCTLLPRDATPGAGGRLAPGSNFLLSIVTRRCLERTLTLG